MIGQGAMELLQLRSTDKQESHCNSRGPNASDAHCNAQPVGQASERTLSANSLS